MPWKRLWKSMWGKVVPIALCLALAGTFLGIQVDTIPQVKDGGVSTIGIGFPVLRVGTVEAAGTADYVCDGTDDNVQIQAALNALPSGGKLVILTGNYVFAATVTRLIDNVQIEGVGRATYISYDGVTPVFAAGGDNWVFRDFRTDAGSISLGATTGYSIQNVMVGTTYLQDVNGRGTYSAASGTPDYLVCQNTAGDDVPGSTGFWVKSGRTGQVVETNAAFSTSFQWALDTANAAGGGNVQIAASSANYTSATGITAKSNVNVDARGAIIVIASNDNAVDALVFNDMTNSLWTNVEIHRTGTCTALPKCVWMTGTLDNTVQVRNFRFFNDVVTTDASTEGLYALIIGSDEPTSPVLSYGYCQTNLTATNADNYATVLWRVYPGSPKIDHLTSVSSNTSGDVGIVVTESAGEDAEITDSEGRGFRGIWLDITTIRMVRDKGYGGAASQGYGWYVRGGAPQIIDPYGEPGKNDGCYGLYAEQTNATIENGRFSPAINQYQWVYSAADSGRFRPFASQRYGVWDGWSIWMATGQPGKTMDIGTTPGGNEIADDIDLTTSGGLYFLPTHVAMAADAYFYATVAGGAPTENVYLYYSVIDDQDDFGGARIRTDNYLKVNNTTFIGSYYSGFGIAAYLINPTGSQTWSFTNCTFWSAAPAGYAVYAASALSGVNIFNPRYIGQLNNISSYADRNSGTATIVSATSNSTTIAHGLATTPTRVFLTFSSTPGAAASLFYTANVTHIVVTAVPGVSGNVTLDWRAVVGEGN